MLSPNLVAEEVNGGQGVGGETWQDHEEVVSAAVLYGGCNTCHPVALRIARELVSFAAVRSYLNQERIAELIGERVACQPLW